MQITNQIPFIFAGMIYQKLLSEIDGGRILDVGCGSGQFTEILTDSLKSFDSITGIDVTEEYLSEARQKFTDEKFQFLVASSQEIPFDDETFDLVVISKALHHVENPHASLAEMKRVLKPGGYFLVVEMHRDELSEAQESHMQYHHLRSEIDNALGISHHHTFHRNDIISLVDELQLTNRTITEFSPDESQAKDPEIIREFIRKMDEWLEQLTGHPEKEKFTRKVDELKKEFWINGISRPPQMVFLGQK